MNLEPNTAVETIAESVCEVIAFPVWRRAGELRAAAIQLAEIEDIERADHIRYALGERLFAELDMLGLSEGEQDEQVGAFFFELDMLLEDYRYDDFEIAPVG